MKMQMKNIVKSYINRYKCSARNLQCKQYGFLRLYQVTETPLQGAIAVVENKSLNFKYSNGFYILVDKSTGSWKFRYNYKELHMQQVD